MSIQIQKVVADTLEMNYFRFGSGEKTMVILPGLSVQSVMGPAQAVADEYAVMKDEFTVYLFDRRTELPPDYNIYDMADDTAKAIKALGLSDIYLFGASQGGMIAMTVAILYPELVRKLALGSTASDTDGMEGGALDKWISLAKDGDRVGLYLEFGRAIYPESVFEQYRDVLAAAGQSVTDEELDRFVILAKGTKGFDMTDRLTEIQCPVLAIGSTDDEVLGAAPTWKIVQRLADRQDFLYHMYEGFGHAAFDTAPDYRERLYAFFMQ